jgi:hypothetical protein
MTAIALLNSEKDPHVVVDTLLSAEGEDPNEKKFIWLPALGKIDSEWERETKIWHISRLGRKSFALPNRSGLLAFSGDCRAAFDFWSELSDDFHQRSLYDSNCKISKEKIYNLLFKNKKSEYFSLLGMVIDDNAKLVPFIHNDHEEILTNNFGKCYVSGSGASLLKKIILDRDDQIDKQGGWRDSIKISATEDLAEHISSVMLYRESDINNGHDTNSPIAAQCGGFYEWYSIRSIGIRPVYPRIDMHLLLGKNGIAITRLYFSEQRLSIPSEFHSIYSLKYPLLIASLVMEFYHLSYDYIKDHDFVVSVEKGWATLIDSTFDRYTHNPDHPLRQSGIVDEKVLDNLIKIRRIRLVITYPDGQATIKGFVEPQGKDSYAEIEYIKNRTVISIDHEIKQYIIDKIRQAGIKI